MFFWVFVFLCVVTCPVPCLSFSPLAVRSRRDVSRTRGAGEHALLGRQRSETPPSSLQATESGEGLESNPFKRFLPVPPPSVDVPSLLESVAFPFSSKSSCLFLGQWEPFNGNFLLRPPEGRRPKALLHFLGGAFVGASPHIGYRFLLERLAERGYLVLATPYKLNFDYLSMCDSIIERFEAAAIPLAREFGALPVVGVGHSCGALQQVLISSCFPGTPRAANVLLSYNNKPVAEAVPLFEEICIPLAQDVVSSPVQRPGGAVRVGSRFLRDTFVEVLDALESQGASRVQNRPSSVSVAVPSESSQTQVDLVAEDGKMQLVPKMEGGGSVSETSRSRRGGERVGSGPLKNFFPLARNAVDFIDQLPELLQSVAKEGTREFTPSTAEVREAVQRMYRTRRTLVIQYDDDALDESGALVGTLRDAAAMQRLAAGQQPAANRPLSPAAQKEREQQLFEIAEKTNMSREELARLLEASKRTAGTGGGSVPSSRGNMEIRMETIGGTHVSPLMPSVGFLPGSDTIPGPLTPSGDGSAPWGVASSALTGPVEATEESIASWLEGFL
uniref:Uncharacterized protein n=1 Tax=Chromera velia CCMP2878 TaxID=1169474 RepID=A0A0G4HPX5_9ALVE|eukprot:Cvel_1246.t1-p1 / transcript=Cvel_1246.t1 / gene=Cvel_1246 / organism=Chromera_velia_CCMP2878 / gene_product=hypothetical protein / transcript_product=hypothetical protein / location=Cvel_scaffold41:149557-151233(+) / protein_length=559 / sequence_SO=supercontig / SO=protein_coding / is_pseudo=false